MNLKKAQSAFTIVELLIVIVVIGILATLALSTISSSQARARDTERITDVRSVQKVIEVFFTANGYYPESGDVSPTQLPQINPASLIDPRGVGIGESDADYVYTGNDCNDGQCSNYVITSVMEKQENYLIQSIN